MKHGNGNIVYYEKWNSCKEKWNKIKIIRKTKSFNKGVLTNAYFIGYCFSLFFSKTVLFVFVFFVGCYSYHIKAMFRLFMSTVSLTDIHRCLQTPL